MIAARSRRRTTLTKTELRTANDRLRTLLAALVTAIHTQPAAASYSDAMRAAEAYLAGQPYPAPDNDDKPVG